jgi:hypothetical protein
MMLRKSNERINFLRLFFRVTILRRLVLKRRWILGCLLCPSVWLVYPGFVPSSKPSWRISAHTLNCCSGNQWEGTRPGWLVLWILSVYSSSGWLCPSCRLDARHQGGLLVPAAWGGSAFTEGGWGRPCQIVLLGTDYQFRLKILTALTLTVLPLYPTLFCRGGGGWLAAVLLIGEYLDFYQNGIFSEICVSINPSWGPNAQN